MIELKNISHKYGEKFVLSGLDFFAEGRKITCLLGTSGSGKTTILRIIAGLETPVSGSVLIDNKIVTVNGRLLVPPHKRNLGFIFQDLALWPHLSVYENIAFGLKARKEKNIERKVSETLDFFGIGDEAKKFPHQLSGGQKQLVAIARAIVLEPKILLMDEPLANLDVKLKGKTIELIKKLRDEFNLTILYVTHDHKEAFSLADKIAVLNNGKIEDEGKPDELSVSDNEFVRFFIER